MIVDDGGDRPGDVVSRLPERAARLSPERRQLLERLRRAPGRPRPDHAVPPGDGGQVSTDPFPLTEVQQAYWIGRDPNLPLGGVAAYGYGEFDLEGLDVGRIEAAWNHLVERHPALRTVVSDDGTQRFLPTVPWYSIPVVDHRGDAEAEVVEKLGQRRAALSHRVPDPSRWPLFDLQATLLPGDRVRLHVGFDTLIADARSFDILAAELDILLAAPDARLDPIGLTFRDYTIATAGAVDDPGVERARAYWFDRLADLPPGPDLPLVPENDVGPVRFVRHAAGITGASWRAFCERAQARRVTPSAVLLGAYAEVLACWSGDPRFTLNLTLFNRRPVHPDVDRVVGCFTELSLLAVDMRSSGTFGERVRRIQDQLWRDLEHREVGAMTVLRELARRTGAPPLMPVVFTSALGTGGGRSRLGRPVYAISQTPQVWIDHQVVESDDGIELWWDAGDDLFPPQMVDEMFGSYVGLVERLCADDGPWAARRPVGASDRMLRVRRGVEPTAVWDAPALLHEAVDLRAADEPAVVGAGGTRTRGELDVRADRLAAALQSLGAERNRLVGVLTGRGPDQVAAVLGILRSGAAYLPLAADLPAERLARLVERAGVGLVVTDATTSSVRLPAGVRPVRIDRELAGAAPAPHGCSPGDLAYVIFTSGSTGTPKGVMISHEAATNTLHDIRRRLSLSASDAVLAVSDLSFDLSVFDIFGLLAAGGAIVTPADGHAAKDPSHWAELVHRHGVTVWNSVPALMRLLVEHLSAVGRVAESLRCTLLSGDWIPVDLPNRIQQVAPNSVVVGAGGATEAAVWSVAHPIDDVHPSWTSVPYGFPLTNQTARVRSVTGDELPDWAAGELHIGGRGVALGYWGEPARTAERFVPDPDGVGGRLYRTGDFSRHLPDGNLEFLGRRDAQVKINGHRVDLAEIENVLASHPAVGYACALATGPRDGARRLRAFVAPSAGVDVEDVRRHAATLLPPYMVPAVVEALDALPLTPNGKVDRAWLGDRPVAEVGRASPAVGPDEGRDRPVADAVARIVAEVLDLERPPGPDDDLLGLGADSMAIVRIGNQLEGLLGVVPPLERVFEDPTAVGIATECERRLLETAARGSPDGGGSVPWEGTPVSSVRQPPPWARRVVLPGSADVGHDDWDVVRSRRHPLGAQVPLGVVAGLLRCLQAVRTPVGDRRLYASAGAIYPVRAYVSVAAGSVEGLSPGVYYHDATEHALVSVGEGPGLQPEHFEPFVSRPIVTRAAFVVLLTAYLPAIAPVYGAHAVRFATLEAGAMAQLLRHAAPTYDLALCLIGDAGTADMRTAAGLEEGEDVVVMAAGGRRDPAEAVAVAPDLGTGLERGEL